MNERKGWLLVWVGVGLLVLVYIGVVLVAFAGGGALMERMLN